jgi:hypothetical protein
VDVLMLDLDVGFIDSPMNIVRKLGTSKSDVFVQVSDNIDHLPCVAGSSLHHCSLHYLACTTAQKDIAFVMNRSLEGWRTWYTVPQANIGDT